MLRDFLKDNESFMDEELYALAKEALEDLKVNSKIFKSELTTKIKNSSNR